MTFSSIWTGFWDDDAGERCMLRFDYGWRTMALLPHAVHSVRIRA
jgi:hypothetical protein